MVLKHSIPKHGKTCELVLEGTRSLAPFLSPDDEDFLSRVVDGISAAGSCNHPSVHSALVTTSTDLVVQVGLHEHVLLTAVRITFHVYLVTKSAEGKRMAQSALRNMLRVVWERMDGAKPLDRRRSSRKGSEGDDESHSSSSAQATFLSQHHADAYFLLRSLCKLSSKELQAETRDEQSNKPARLFNSLIPTDPTELNSKLLALELILYAMEMLNDSCTADPKFIQLLQTYLCGSLLKNCVSNSTRVAFLSQRIFLVLVHKCKGHLKQDIEVVLSNVFFRVLDSPNASFQQKALVLESLRSLCRDPVLLTQIFVEYDCDAHSMSHLYKDIVQVLTKTAAVGNRLDPLIPLAALECLVTILRTFLQALGLPVAAEIESAGTQIRATLHLEPLDNDTGESLHAPTAASEAGSVVSEDTTSIVLVSGSSHSAPAPLNSAGACAAADTTDVAGKIVDAFDKKQMAQQNFEMGAVKFTLSLKNGLRFFIDNDFVECHAQSIARFFLDHKDTLDKTQLGEALGREPDAAFVKQADVTADTGGPGFWVRILHYYIDALDFTDMVFDEAIRLFLSGFRLPGEAQKIDRIMEKFAERYTSQNPSVFPSSDTAFILAFSVIMLYVPRNAHSVSDCLLAL